jgi:hypothetical protein
MNEQIKRLALRAGHPGYPRGESELQKFAELIVEKCIASLQVPKADLKYLSEYNQGWVAGRMLAIENIKKDFEIL